MTGLRYQGKRSLPHPGSYPLWHMATDPLSSSPPSPCFHNTSYLASWYSPHLLTSLSLNPSLTHLFSSFPHFPSSFLTSFLAPPPPLFASSPVPFTLLIINPSHVLYPHFSTLSSLPLPSLLPCITGVRRATSSCVPSVINEPLQRKRRTRQKREMDKRWKWMRREEKMREW